MTSNSMLDYITKEQVMNGHVRDVVNKIEENITPPGKCAPSKTFEDGSCFTLDNLKSIANEYNKNYRDKIPLSKIGDNKKRLLRYLTIKMSSRYGCKTQECWLRSKEVKLLKDEDIKYNTFRPAGPKKQFEWLSTTDINKVMYQYEFKHPEFKFLGAVPSDFDELPQYGTTDLDFGKLEKTTYKLGLVINLDTHNMGGSHWVALFVNLRENQIYYFDSFGKKPQKRVTLFIRRILTYMYNKKFKTEIDMDEFMKKFHSSDDYDIRFNKIQHQFKNSECGVYSMNFIIRLLGGKDFDSIVENITNDDIMNSCRKIYFKN
jgi:hypothetical protein